MFILVEKHRICKFKEYLNSKHENINFTNILIKRNSASFVTSVHRKPIFTSVYTQVLKSIKNLKNGSPLNFINFYIKHFLDQIFIKKINPVTAPKKDFFIILLYLDNFSDKVWKQISHFFNKLISFHKVNIIFKTQS